MSHNTTPIALILKIRLGLDSQDFKLDCDTIKVHLTSSLIKLFTHKLTASFTKISQKQCIKSNEKLSI